RSGPIADEQLAYEFLFDDPYWVVVGAQNPWARRRRIDLAELVNEQWVLPPPQSTLGAVVMKTFRASGLAYPRTHVIGEPAELRIRLLATGRFVTMFPDSVMRFSAMRPELKVLPVKQALGSMPVGIVTLKNRTISPLAQMFINTSREVAKQTDQ